MSARHMRPRKQLQLVLELVKRPYYRGRLERTTAKADPFQLAVPGLHCLLRNSNAHTTDDTGHMNHRILYAQRKAAAELVSQPKYL